MVLFQVIETREAPLELLKQSRNIKMEKMVVYNYSERKKQQGPTDRIEIVEKVLGGD